MPALGCGPSTKTTFRSRTSGSSAAVSGALQVSAASHHPGAAVASLPVTARRASAKRRLASSQKYVAVSYLPDAGSGHYDRIACDSRAPRPGFEPAAYSLGGLAKRDRAGQARP